MKRKKIHLQIISFIFFAILFATACKDELDDNGPAIAGYYRVESLSADRQVDLNNDGNVSTNVMEEISQSNNNNQYNFNSPDTYLEIRPTKFSDNTNQYLYIPFPDPRLTFSYTDSPKWAVTYLRNGLNGIGYRYSYDEKKKAIYLDLTNVEQKNEELWGKLLYIKPIDKDRLELSVSKNYYDFRTASWIRLQLIGIYIRVEN